MVMLTSLLISTLNILGSAKKKSSNSLFPRETTMTINGFFVILVFISHFKNYIDINGVADYASVKVASIFGQLMVVSFLFFSGYGIMSQLSKDKESNIKKMKSRLVKVWINFCISIVIFLVYAYYRSVKYSLNHIILSFIGWETVGNSAWYMFAIFSLYIITIISIYVSKNDKPYVLG